MPHDITLLNDLLILLLAALPIAFLCHRLRLPVMVGFMLTGIIIGPSGAGLIRDPHAVELLAEIGVVLLLFTIGLEFSLQRMMEMKRLVVLGGGLQVVLTLLIAFGLAYLFGRSFSQSAFFGFLFALSSTAIVLKSYMDRAEVETPHGKAGVGILLFQDLCIVPMMLLTPVLSGKEGSDPTQIVLALGEAALAIAAIILTARFVVPFLLGRIVKLRSPEIFIVFVVLVSLGTASVTAHFGLSLALGAFIAGLVLSESEYSHQIVSDVLPFRDVFNSLFFISIGMLLSLAALLANLPTVLFLLTALIVGKALIVFVVALLLGNSLRVATMIGLGLAQVGEFSFILAKVGAGQGLISDNDYQQFLAASILSMILTPFLIKVAPRAGYGLQTLISPKSKEDLSLEPPESTDAQKGHVVIVGYGMNGHNLAKVLSRTSIPHKVLELNAENVRKGKADGAPIYYGDATRREILLHAGLASARILAIAISDLLATRRIVALAREMNPDLRIIVRTRYMSELNDLFSLGANQVIPEEFETSIEIFSRVLREYGVGRNLIEREVQEIRREGYKVLRSASLPLAGFSVVAETFGSVSSETVFIDEHSPAIGKTLSELNLRRSVGVTVIAAICDSNTRVNLGPEFRISANDILVLLGSPEQIEQAQDILNNEHSPSEHHSNDTGISHHSN
ncbi:MAG: cation:proton antiporter [Acidobacteriota bacterium]|nr:cation:proton antiporter [Acidobacteriota bacterium]